MIFSASLVLAIVRLLMPPLIRASLVLDEVPVAIGSQVLPVLLLAPGPGYRDPLDLFDVAQADDVAGGVRRGITPPAACETDGFSAPDRHLDPRADHLAGIPAHPLQSEP